jgi:hypothetical protein
MSFRKNPKSSRQKPPTKSRAIHVLPLPLATSERNSAINHINKASFRITNADYTTSDLSTCVKGKQDLRGKNAVVNERLLAAQVPGLAAIGACPGLVVRGFYLHAHGPGNNAYNRSAGVVA